MGFSGDLKDIDLSNIFQTLGMNQHEGILKVSGPNQLARMYFSKEGIRLLVDGTKPYSLLGELLLRRKLVSEGDLAKALKLQKETGRRMGELLVEINALSEEDLTKVLRDQMEEKIYEVFSWKEARFEFLAEAPVPEDPLFLDGKTEQGYLTFNINSIMMEAARRIDEWGLINLTIPRRTEVVTLIHPADEVARYEYGLAQGDVASVVYLINGHRSVQKIILESGLGNFRTCKILKALIDEGHAELVPTADLVRLAGSFMSAGRIVEGVETFRTAIARAPDDIELRLNLAQIALDKGEAEVAAEEYTAVGEICEQSGERRKALESYTTAVELHRADLKAHERLFSLYQTLGETHLALEEGRLLARLYSDKKNFGKAEQVLQELEKTNKTNVGIKKELVKIYLDRKEKEKAISELHELALSCEKKRRFAEAEEAYETILRLDPDRRDIAERAAQVGRRVRRPARKRRSRRVLLSIILIGLLGYGGWEGFQALQEARVARKGVEELLAGIALLKPFSALQDDEENFQEALEETGRWLVKVTEMMEQSPWELEELRKQKAALTERSENLKSRIRGLQDAVKRKNQDLFQEAARLKEQGKLREALVRAKAVLDAGEEHNHPSILERATQMISEIEGRQEGAAELLLLARDAEAAGAFSKAYEYYADLLERFPDSDSATRVSYPLVVETVPPGVTVTRGSDSLGATPLVFHYGPEEDWTLTFSKTGYTSQELSRRWVPLAERQAAKVQRTLEKTFQWALDLGSRVKVKADLVSVEGMVLAPTMDSRVFRIDVGEANVGSEVKLGSLGSILASGIVREGILYVGSKNSTVAAIDARTGDRIWEQELGGFQEGIEISPAISGDGKILLVAGGETLFALNAKDLPNRTPIWTMRFNGKITIPPVVLGSTALVHRPGSRELQRIRVSDKTEVGPSFELPETPKGPLVLAGGEKVIYADVSGRVRAIDPESGAELWHTGGLGKVLAAVPVGDRIWVSLDLEGGTVLVLGLEDGQEVWEKRLQVTGKTVSVLRREDTLYFGTDAKSALAVDVKTGQVVWDLALPAGVEAAPCFANGFVFFAAQNGKIYAVLPLER